MFVCEGSEPLSLEEISLSSGASREAEQPAAALCGREPSGEGQRSARTSLKPPASRERTAGTLTERQAYRLAVEESKRAAECLVGAEEGTDAACCQGPEPASSKDTNTLDVRANSPRNSKSSGAVSQRKGSLESTVLQKDLDVECSLSSLSESARNTQRAPTQPDTPRGAAAGSDVSNHSQLRASGDHFAAAATPQGSNKRQRVDDGKEADSHHTPRSKDLQHKRAMPVGCACSGPPSAQQGDEPEEIQSRPAKDGSEAIRVGIEGTRDNGVEARTPLRVRTTNIVDPGCKPGVLGVKEKAVKLEEYVDRLLDDPANTETLGHEPRGCKPGTKRPRTLTTEGAAAGLPVRKAEVTDECPPPDGAAARGDPRRPGSAFSEATQQTGAQHAQTAAKQLKVRVGPEAPEAEEEESMSRAHSTAEALAAKDEVAVEEPASPPTAKKAAKRKQPRSKPETRRGSQPLQQLGRRASRSDSLANDPSLGGGSADEDYLPCGAELGEALPVAGARRPRAARTRTAAVPKQPPCPAASTAPAASTIQRSNSRLRWSGSLGSPLGSGSAARRLRSQPLDVSCLSPDAFPPLEPPHKRPRHSPLLAACASVRQLQTRDGRLFEPGKSLGVCKPRPFWQGPEEARLDAALQQLTEASPWRARQLHSGDIHLLDGPAPNTDVRSAWDATAQRLGQGRLAKAMRALGGAEEVAATAVPEQTGGVVSFCARVMPSCLEAACTGWTKRLEAPCAGSFAETSTCIKSRAERDLQNIWDDMLARHALEAKTLQSFRQWLAPALLDGEE